MQAGKVKIGDFQQITSTLVLPTPLPQKPHAKTSTTNQIEPELLKYGTVAILHLTKLSNSIWDNNEVLDDWKHGITEHLPKM